MSTDELTNKLKEYKHIDDFMRENAAEFDEEAFKNYLDTLRRRRDISISGLADVSGVSTPYAYELFRGRKDAPRKDILLRLAFALQLTLDETNRLLTLGGASTLRSKNRRESILIFCIENGMPAEQADELLYRYGLPGVGVAEAN